MVSFFGLRTKVTKERERRRVPHSCLSAARGKRRAAFLLQRRARNSGVLHSCLSAARGTAACCILAPAQRAERRLSAILSQRHARNSGVLHSCFSAARGKRRAALLLQRLARKEDCPQSCPSASRGKKIVCNLASAPRAESGGWPVLFYKDFREQVF